MRAWGFVCSLELAKACRQKPWAGKKSKKTHIILGCENAACVQNKHGTCFKVLHANTPKRGAGVKRKQQLVLNLYFEIAGSYWKTTPTRRETEAVSKFEQTSQIEQRSDSPICLRICCCAIANETLLLRCFAACLCCFPSFSYHWNLRKLKTFVWEGIPGHLSKHQFVVVPQQQRPIQDLIAWVFSKTSETCLCCFLTLSYHWNLQKLRTCIWEEVPGQQHYLSIYSTAFLGVQS